MPPSARALAMRNEAAEGNFRGRDGKTWNAHRVFSLQQGGHLVQLRAPNGMGGNYRLGSKGVETELVYVVGKIPTNRVVSTAPRNPVMVADPAGALQRIAAMACEGKRDESALAKPGTVGTTETVIFPGGGTSGPTGYGSAVYDNDTGGESFLTVVRGTPDEGLTVGGADWMFGRLLAYTVSDEFRLSQRGGGTFDLSSLAGQAVTAANVWFQQRTSFMTYTNGDGHLQIVEWSPTAYYDFALGDFAPAKYGSARFVDTDIDFNPNTETYDIALNAAGVAYLNGKVGGIAALGFQLIDQMDETLEGDWTSGGDKYFSCYGTDQAGDTIDARITITSEPAASGGMSMLMKELLGL